MFKKVLIGSMAARHWFDDFRYPEDTDFLVDGAIPHDGETEYYDINCNEGLRVIYNISDEICKPELLYTMKMSHCFWDINWLKTMSDISFYQNKGVELNIGIRNVLYDGWVKIHGEPKVNLNVPNEKFFNGHVLRTFDHDEIHRAVAYYGKPIYESCKNDLGSAFVSKKLFYGLSQDDRLKMCREEAYVIALERFIIPNRFTYNRKVAYINAMKLLVTQLSKGWFPRYIVSHWNTLKELDPTHDFVALAKEKLPCTT